MPKQQQQTRPFNNNAGAHCILKDSKTGPTGELIPSTKQQFMTGLLIAPLHTSDSKNDAPVGCICMKVLGVGRFFVKLDPLSAFGF